MSMESKETYDFLSQYQKIFLEDTGNKPLKTAEVHRLCIDQLFHVSTMCLDNATTCNLLEHKLKKLSDVSDNGKIYQQPLKDKLRKLQLCNQFELQSNLDNVDIKAMISPLNCSNNGELKCQVSEHFSEPEFIECASLLQKKTQLQQDVTKSIKCTNNTMLSTYGQNNLVNNKSSKDNVIYNKRSEDNSAKAFQSCFKTAHEELQIQSMKKFGNSQMQANSSAGQKRKLGTRRNLNSKFISPLLSNNGSEELSSVKSEEWATDVDDRLKNIEPKMVELIKSEIMDCGQPVTWNDIAGLEFAKTAIQEAVVWPLLRPDIFTGLRRPPKGILLFGPPGTGKTLIGKCVASQSKSTFFSISASSLTSKWVGDGEKMVRALFAVARCHQPAVIFIDEIDSLLSQRSDTEHESSRRIKTEFLVQLDGATTESEERLLVIGATNRPQELDEAARRRFVKRLYIPLPENEARLQLVKKLVLSERYCLTEDDFKEIASLSDGYSGADIRTLCAEASLGPIRSLDLSTIQNIQVAEVRPVLMEDFKKAFTRVRSSVAPKDLDQYIVWDNTYGSGL